MWMLRELFLEIMQISVIASFAILSVLTVRFFIRKLPKKYSYILWAAVAFRLIIPSSAVASISMFHLPVTKLWPAAAKSTGLISALPELPLPKSGQEDTKKLSPQINSLNPNPVPPTETLPREIQVSGKLPLVTTPSPKTIDILACIWLTGIAALVFRTAITVYKLKQKLACAIKLYDNIYQCDAIPSPFILGIFRPKIYMPFRLSEAQQRCILLHENCHIKRNDHLIKSFAYALTIFYWFHPLVRLSYSLMCRDMEMSCDEKVISTLNTDIKKEYSLLLLAFATNKRPQIANTPAFGETDTRRRIQHIATYQKPTKWSVLGGAAAIVLTVAACGTDAPSHPDPYDNAAPKAAIQETSDTADAKGTKTSSVTMEPSLPSTETGLAHQPASWASNSMFDLEFCTLDYADENTIIFHISSGLFQYSLNENKMIASLDLKALDCQEVQTGGICRIEVYTADKNRQKAVITPYPYHDKDRYVYDFQKDELTMYDDSALEGYAQFGKLIPKGMVNEEDLDLPCPAWKCSETIARFDDQTYGVLYFDTIHLATIKYTAGGQIWKPFHPEWATQPDLLKQDDSFYESFAEYCGKSVSQCVMEYMGFYRQHDYAGICALSTGLEYSDETQKEWLAHTDILNEATELSASETEYLYQFVRQNGPGDKDGELVAVTFTYVEGLGWRAKGLPVPYGAAGR